MFSSLHSTCCAFLSLTAGSFCAAFSYGGMQSYQKLILPMVFLITFFFPGRCSGLSCPSSCSTLTHLPYPFGAAPGCGSPGFLLDCSSSPPQWNVTTGGYTSHYYIVSIGSNPNHSNPQAGSYGYGGTVLMDVRPSYTNSTCHVLDAATAAANDFITSDLYSFEYADLIYYQDSFLFFNCTESQQPLLGVLINSSSSCAAYLKYCGFSNTTCLEYRPDQQLQLALFKSAYHCSTRARFVIPPGDENISTWIPYTQFAWGPVRDADSCYACQRTGGTCGYDTQDNSFLCYCGDKEYQKDCSKLGSSTAIAIGASAPSAVVLLGFLLGIGFICRHKCGLFASGKVLTLDGIHEAALEFPHWALSAATKSFSTKIGQGAFAKVYRGLLYDGSEIAVKVLDPSVSYTDEQCLNEVATIGNIHHTNIARLVGYCFKKSRRVLVYEYVSNGSLDKYLFPNKAEAGVPVLNWKQRFEIALGVARGLSYMHEECRRCIIHCDIKPQNILLDAVFRPKIADFGLARLLKREESKVLTHARGTPGYVAPEFWSLGSGPLSAKFDVYSYGIVLLEIIRGRRSFKEFDPFCQEEADFDSFVSLSVDERIEDNVNLKQAQMCTQVALLCIQEDPAMRPAMSLVVQFLQGTAVVPDNVPLPFRPRFRSESSSEALPKSSDGSYTFCSSAG